MKSLPAFIGFTLFFTPLLLSRPAAAVQDSPAPLPQEIRTAVETYLKSAAGADRDAAWKKIQAYDALKPEQVAEWTTFIADQLKKDVPADAGTKPTEFKYVAEDGKEYASRYYSYFSGDAKSGKTYPLFVILHSGGGKKDHSSSALKELTWWPKQKDAIAVAPVCRTDFSPNVHWNSRPNYNMISYVIEDMIRKYPVDTNRIYLLGCSMGGWGAWSLSSLHADRIAGAVSHSGGVWLKPNYMFPLENLLHVPLYIHHGGNENPPWDSEPGPKPAIELLEKWRRASGGYEMEVVNKEGQGHCSSSGAEREAMMKWLLKHTRNPFPKKIIWKLTDSSHPSLYWLKLASAKGRPVLQAEIKGNQIEIQSQNLKSGLTVFVNDKLVNMNKPVTVVLDGEKKFSAVVKPSLAALAESFEAKKDPELAFWGKIKLD